MLHHFTHRTPDHIWHAVYMVPATGIMSSIGNALTERGARAMCDDANREQAAKERAAAAASMHPADRKIPRGFYTDEDAA